MGLDNSPPMEGCPLRGRGGYQLQPDYSFVHFPKNTTHPVDCTIKNLYTWRRLWVADF